jgi:hypothetical protein
LVVGIGILGILLSLSLLRARRRWAESFARVSSAFPAKLRDLLAEAFPQFAPQLPSALFHLMWADFVAYLRHKTGARDDVAAFAASAGMRENLDSAIGEIVFARLPAELREHIARAGAPARARVDDAVAGTLESLF